MTLQAEAPVAGLPVEGDRHLSGEPEGVTPPRLPGEVTRYMWLPVRPCLMGVSAARKAVRATLRRWELTDVAEDIELLVSELVGNAVIHGAGPVTITMEQRHSSLLLLVGDGSEERPGPGGDSDILSEGGRGLWLVAHIADDCGWTPAADGKVVWCCLNLPRGGQEQHATDPGRRAGECEMSIPRWSPPQRRAAPTTSPLRPQKYKAAHHVRELGTGPSRLLSGERTEQDIGPLIRCARHDREDRVVRSAPPTLIARDANPGHPQAAC